MPKGSDTFRDAWKSLRRDDQSGSVSTASVDLREQKDSYTVRLNLPERDLEKVKITFPAVGFTSPPRPKKRPGAMSRH